MIATENDTLNAITMLFEHLLTDCPGIFADVRTYWSPEAVERVDVYKRQVLGGIGNIKGAMLGGLLLGMIEVMLQSFDSSISYGASFVILILVLLYRPAGLLGTTVTEKV